ncbi:MAG TPA: trehalose-6-phosphate synthase [Acidimicrobiales bacterium]|jgi:trehalose 6-phosphate synthase|nr:trehalose-6-phosphate synthase [Acidimicrobiales bacterium]
MDEAIEGSDGAPGAGASLVVMSNRGPLNFTHGPDGELQARRSAGGLVVTLGPGVERAGALWMASAISDADRTAASRGVVESDGFRLRSLVIEPDTYRAYYDVVANGSLWYVLHGLWDLPRRPRFDRHWHRAWDAYVAVNRHFADAAAQVAGPDATVLVQDYHLALVPGALGAARPDLHVTTFLHTPWCSPAEFAVLPDRVGRAVLEGLAGGGGRGSVGFHSPRWARAFEACCHEVLGRCPPTFVAPAAPDAADTRSVAASPACAEALASLDAEVGDRRLIVRVDRIELSKNVLRGFHAFDELLGERADLRGRVVFGAFVYPSRQGLADYLAYGQEVVTLSRVINERWGTPEWTPILLDADDGYPLSVAAMRRADVLLVNPVRDGLNLVAKELAIANERDAVLVLSRQAGCWEELRDHALVVNPFDVTATAAALGRALDMPAAERRERAAALRKLVEARTPIDWFDDLVRAAG